MPTSATSARCLRVLPLSSFSFLQTPPELTSRLLRHASLSLPSIRTACPRVSLLAGTYFTTSLDLEDEVLNRRNVVLCKLVSVIHLRVRLRLDTAVKQGDKSAIDRISPKECSLLLIRLYGAGSADKNVARRRFERNVVPLRFDKPGLTVGGYHRPGTTSHSGIRVRRRSHITGARNRVAGPVFTATTPFPTSGLASHTARECERLRPDPHSPETAPPCVR